MYLLFIFLFFIIMNSILVLVADPIVLEPFRKICRASNKINISNALNKLYKRVHSMKQRLYNNRSDDYQKMYKWYKMQIYNGSGGVSRKINTSELDVARQYKPPQIKSPPSKEGKLIYNIINNSNKYDSRETRAQVLNEWADVYKRDLLENEKYKDQLSDIQNMDIPDYKKNVLIEKLMNNVKKVALSLIIMRRLGIPQMKSEIKAMKWTQFKKDADEHDVPSSIL